MGAPPKLLGRILVKCIDTAPVLRDYIYMTTTRNIQRQATIAALDLSREMDVSLADVLVLIDQLTDIDGAEATVAGIDRWTGTPLVTPEAADTIREQLGWVDTRCGQEPCRCWHCETACQCPDCVARRAGGAR